MNLIEYIDQPPATGESGLSLQDFLGDEVFFKKPESEDSAQPINPDTVAKWSLEAKRIGDSVVLVFYTSHTNSRLGNEFAGLPLRECLQLSFDYPGVDGVALVNPTMSWKVFFKESIEKALGAYQGGGYR
jgi:hypothetical protein